MRVIIATLMVAGMLGALSGGVSAAGCKKGYTYDANLGKCVKIHKGSH